jgi:hypothetical protein
MFLELQALLAPKYLFFILEHLGPVRLRSKLTKHFPKRMKRYGKRCEIS